MVLWKFQCFSLLFQLAQAAKSCEFFSCPSGYSRTPDATVGDDYSVCCIRDTNLKKTKVGRFLDFPKPDPAPWLGKKKEASAVIPIVLSVSISIALAAGIFGACTLWRDRPTHQKQVSADERDSPPMPTTKFSWGRMTAQWPRGKVLRLTIEDGSVSYTHLTLPTKLEV